MAIVMETPLRNALAQAIIDEIDAGVAVAQGYMLIETSADAEVARLDFNAPPSFGAPASGTITLNGTPKQDTTAAGGTAAQFSIYDRDNTKQLEGVVAVSGQDLDLSSLSVGIGDTVELTSFSITVPGI